MRLPAIRRRPPAAWAQRSTRPWSTAATSAASARERRATSWGTAASTSRPRASASRSDASSGPCASLARTDSSSASLSPEPDEQGVPALCLGQCGQRQVLGREALHALSLVLVAPDHLVRRHVGPLVAQDSGQHLASRHRFDRLVVRGLRVGVVVGVHVEPVVLPSPGGRDVEDLAGGGRGDHGVRRVDAAALGPVRRRGVGQLDVLGHVGGREHHFPGALDPLEGHGAVVVGGSHGPLVAVADPASAGAESPVVLTGDHLVAHPGRPTTGHVQPALFHLSGGDPLGPGPAR